MMICHWLKKKTCLHKAGFLPAFYKIGSIWFYKSWSYIWKPWSLLATAIRGEQWHCCKAGHFQHPFFKKKYKVINRQSGSWYLKLISDQKEPNTFSQTKEIELDWVIFTNYLQYIHPESKKTLNTLVACTGLYCSTLWTAVIKYHLPICQE